MKKTILTALSNHLGDDLYKAKNAFKNYTPKMMNEQYGHSGQTPNKILESYQKHYDKVTEAIRFVERL